MINESYTDTSQLYRVVVGQLIITAVVALGFLLKGYVASYSVVIGGGIAVLSNIYFVRFVFKLKRRLQPKKFLSGLYVGESVKFIVAFALFGLVFKLYGEKTLNVDALALFVGFIATNFAYWYALRTYK